MPLTVLLVDDDELDRRALRRAIGGATLAVELQEATSAAEALERLDEGGIDCAIIDYRLPGIDGLELLAEVRRRGYDVPFVALTGQGDEALAVELMKAGAVDYLSKEWVTPDRLERSLRHAVAMAEAERLQSDLLAREHASRQEAEAANRAKDQFLAALSHELRSPLSAILGWTHLIQSGTLAEPTVARALAIVHRNALVLSRQIDDLLDISRIASGTLALETQRVDLVPLVESVIDTLRPTTETRGLTVRCRVRGEPRPLTGDPERLTQVFTNLLSNAVKFSHEDDTVDVTIEYQDTSVRIAVRDRGAGIAADFLPHVFSAFRQADTTNTRRHGGLGLGLSIVQRLVALHGGSVTAESDGIDRGATFTVVLPADRAADRAAGDRDGRGSLAGIRVLVVDDDDDALQLIATLLTRKGASVVTATSAPEALRLRRDVGPDVLLSDLSMPDRDGFWLIERIRAEERRRNNGAHLPAAAVTALTLASDTSKALTAGFDVHVPKPVDPDRFVDLVARLAQTGAR